MISRRRFMATAAAAALPVNGRAKDLSGDKIIETATGQSIGFDTLIDRLAEAKTVLIGERHGFAPQQDRIAWMLEELALRGRFPTLALEMLEPAQIPALKAYRADNPEYVGGLGAALNWSETGWPAWHFYEPVFRAAFRAKLDFLAIDLPRDTQRKIDREGQIPPDDAKELVEYWRPIVKAIQCNDIGDTWLTNVATRQSVRDIHMSEMINRIATPLVALVGRRHLPPLSDLLNRQDNPPVTVGFGTVAGSQPDYQIDTGHGDEPLGC